MVEDVSPVNVEEPAPDASQIRTFLIADVRGYTVFTQERGDEAAARLASRFAEVAREVVETRDGTVVELRGDEALAVFDSARQAIRASIELQRRFVDETVADPTLPLAVGIGLDAGEAVAVGDGFRGGALNLAARLCGIAGPAEVLASPAVTHLARKVEGVAYVDRGPVQLKGLADPVNVVRLRAEADDAGRPVPRGTKGNLVLRPQGIEPFAQRILNVEEKTPRVAVGVIHPQLGLESDNPFFPLSGLKKALGTHGLKGEDIILKKFVPPIPEPWASTYAEFRYEQLERGIARAEDLLKTQTEVVKEVKGDHKEWTNTPV